MKFITMTILTLFLASCSTMRAPSINMLERRADYDGNMELDSMLEESTPLFVPNKTRPQEVDIYIHPHETVHGDYFRGGFIRSVVKGSQWELTKVEAPPVKEEVRKKVEAAPKRKKRETPKLINRTSERR
ncbi:MAG: hypothetical protein COV91_03450 [Candidatus Taylorbacteria bacterium CG11_big_fil_rev_8_21_14_0_20_46_11]|uniref:Uncharacterized protein n=1 Tax=Candidatus Taylorbacteria bacterium CG11_big_fil_rev_8_21_14_0_20_46_11 TaxID=1975025 RepID=A0A2H0KBG8_9BACT|nr:MAG: hypothetical protein COV91_03450 [Candidatus Taylorbacteria bacterium CG11_big_fil_rev_8_21_14_0_20_46_11]